MRTAVHSTATAGRLLTFPDAQPGDIDGQVQTTPSAGRAEATTHADIDDEAFAPARLWEFSGQREARRWSAMRAMRSRTALTKPGESSVDRDLTRVTASSIAVTSGTSSDQSIS